MNAVSGAASWRARAAAWLLAVPLVLPLAMLFASWTTVQPDLWRHLAGYVLADAAWNSIVLALLLAGLSGVLGIGLAWLTVHCEFPGRRWLQWALVLPLAVPNYVAAFAYVGITDYAGPLQSAWRALSGSRAALPDARGLLGAAWVLGLVLYPYVYLMARAAFLRQGAAAFDAARSLGHGPWSAFFRVALPLTGPAWAAGIALAVLEALADFGTVSILGVDTITTAIYRAWFGLYSLPTAAQLASLLLLVVALVLLLEAVMRRAGRHAERSVRPMPRIALSRRAAWASCMAAVLVVVLGFGLPLLQLLAWAVHESLQAAVLSRTALNTLALGAMVAAGVLALGLAFATLQRRGARDPWLRLPVFAANLGYAVPGTVIAVAIMLSVVWLEQALQSAMGFSIALSSSLVAVVCALIIRFLRVGYGSMDAGLHALRPELTESARLLGAGRWRRLRRITLPLLRPSAFAALLLVGVETMKELPATLMLRPFGWDTLAVKIYGYTSEGLWSQAAWPALFLIAAGLLPIRWLVRAQDV